MSSEYHGWDEEDDHWRFANVIGSPKNDSVFVIEDFGAETTPREALSAIMSAMAQFKDRIQIVQSERNDRLIVKLKATSMLRVAEIQSGDTRQWGILSVQMNQPPKKRFKWKFWAS